ncbi:hypothetical protein [Arthrobacter castelli]|uniref:hypothetical protein n=1 Tax=Arthrobacter castelli TaxID=271431 RepID=UPI000416116C|nr:hypothetical protein [Arthrobacter castelli]
MNMNEYPAWTIRMDDETAWGPSHPVTLDNETEIDLALSYHPDEGSQIHLDNLDPMSISDVRQLVGALLNLTEIVAPGQMDTQKLRDAIDATRAGLADADDLDAALTALEHLSGRPVTIPNDSGNEVCS